jgi:hypothetical protein
LPDERELILLGETTDITVRAEKPDEHGRVSSGLCARPRIIVEKGDGLTLIPLPKQGERQYARCNALLTKESGNEFATNAISFTPVGRPDALSIEATPRKPDSTIKLPTTSFLKKPNPRPSVAE